MNEPTANNRALIPLGKRRQIAEALAGLPAWDQQILVLRYGLDRGEPRTIDEVAAALRIPRWMLQDHLDAALEQLGEALRHH